MTPDSGKETKLVHFATLQMCLGPVGGRSWLLAGHQTLTPKDGRKKPSMKRSKVPLPPGKPSESPRRAGAPGIETPNLQHFGNAFGVCLWSGLSRTCLEDFGSC